MRKSRLITLSILCSVVLPFSSDSDATEQTKSAVKKPLRVAAIVTVFRRNAHAEMIAGRLLEGYNLDGKPPRPSLQLVSLYVDQFPKGDLSRALAKKHRVRLCKTIEEALTLGTGKLAVDGVLIVAEHGDYPNDPKTGQKQYPKRRFFEPVFRIFAKSGRVVPVFTDKHLSHNWKDANGIFTTAAKLQVPLMAGSSVPSFRREPPLDVNRKRKLAEIVAIGYGGDESYGFHALEMLQSLAERRQGGETGVVSVQCLTGEAVWKAAGKLYDPKLVEAALNASKKRRRADKPLHESVKHPTLFSLRYADGLKASMLMLSGTAIEFSAAWRYADSPNERAQATLFSLQEERPYSHFTILLQGIEQMMHTGRPTWPPERTLLTTGVLHEAMLSKSDDGKLRKTPHLRIRYSSRWNWKQPELPAANPKQHGRKSGR